MHLLGLLPTILDVVLPPRCPGCGTTTHEAHRFCPTCWHGLDWLTDSGCDHCGHPLPSSGTGLCGRCLDKLPRHDRVHAAVGYNDIARRLVLRMKYARRPGFARTIATLAATRATPPRGAMLVPVPLHRWRIWGRGFNQAAAIGAHLARAWGVAHELDLLVRKRATPSLRGLGPSQRARAVRGSFDVRRRIDGASVYLIDDVYTTGATADACAAALKRAGAREVSVVCWARVVRDS